MVPFDGTSEETPLDRTSGEMPLDGTSGELPLDGPSGETAFDRHASERGAFDTWWSERFRYCEESEVHASEPQWSERSGDRIFTREKREREVRDLMTSSAEPSEVAKSSSPAAGDEGSLSRSLPLNREI